MNRKNSRASNYDVINLMDVFKYILKYYKLIILTTVGGLVIGIVLSIASYMRGEMSKQYVIKTSIAVTSQTEDGLFSSNSLNPNSTDIHLAEDMVDSVIFVIRSDRTLEKAVDELKLIGVSGKDIYDNMELSQYNKTQIIDISLYWRNAEEGIKILEAINKVAPKILMDILKIGGVRVVNDPTAQYLIGGSLKASTWVFMTVMGLFAGIGISILMMFIRPTLINSDDAQHKLGLDILGEIPKDRHYPAKGELLTDRATELSRHVNDSYMSMAHVLQKKADKKQCRIMYVTSSGKEEGKTSVTANLGIDLADFEKKVLLVDMDMESPGLGSRFIEKIEMEHSLNALYQGDITIDEAIVSVTGHLHVLPLIHDSKEIIMNETMLNMIAEKAKEYDYTIIDASSVGSASDVLRLNKIADAAIYVIQYDKYPIRVIEDSLRRLERTEIPVIGCVINKAFV